MRSPISTCRSKTLTPSPELPASPLSGVDFLHPLTVFVFQAASIHTPNGRARFLPGIMSRPQSAIDRRKLCPGAKLRRNRGPTCTHVLLAVRGTLHLHPKLSSTRLERARREAHQEDVLGARRREGMARRRPGGTSKGCASRTDSGDARAGRQSMARRRPRWDGQEPLGGPVQAVRSPWLRPGSARSGVADARAVQVERPPPR